MKVLLAGSRGHMEDSCKEFDAPYLMGSFYYMKDAPTSGSGEQWKVEYRDHPGCKGIMVDSGAFSYIKDGSDLSADDVDWYDYAEKYAEFVRKHDIKRWIELDLDGPKSYEFALELREYMEDIVGRDCIPVWHRSRGKRAFKRMCTNYDLVAMGGFPWNEIPPKEYKYLPWFIKEAHKRNARIHALGFQPTSGQMEKYPFDSTDSSNWIFGSFGSWMQFNGTGLERIKHEKSVTPEMYHHNLREWIKLARYMDGRNEPDIGVTW